MIIRSLVDYYEQLLEHKMIAPMGWSAVGVTHVLMLSDDGFIDDICDVRVVSEKGKLHIKKFELPLPAHRSIAIKSSFLSGNSKYVLGLDFIDDSVSDDVKARKILRAKDCFAAAKDLHEEILAGVDTPCAKSVLAFFNHWSCSMNALAKFGEVDLKLLLKSANIIFCCNEGYPHEDQKIRKAWDDHYSMKASSKSCEICCITGERTELEMVHNSIKLRGALSSGASLVSYNGSAFCSYGRTQGENASIGKYAAFAYTSALNYLLSSDDHTIYIGDTAFVFWADDCTSAYQSFFSKSLFTVSDDYSERDLFDMLTRLCAGASVDFEESLLSPDMRFHVLGLSPNAGRVAVKFYYENSFGTILKNVKEHHECLNIIHSSHADNQHLTVWKLMRETVNSKSKTAKPLPGLTSELVRAIITGAPYPLTLLNGISMRMSAERNINYVKAALLKAIYLKKINKGFDYPEEVLTVSLCMESRSVPYNLGRIFAILEKIQREAVPGLQTGIRDRYWTSMAATPANVLPVLINLAQKHLKKFSTGRRVYYERMISEIMEMLGEEYPVVLSFPEQGAFQLGYYHQNQYLYTKKEELYDER